MYDFWYEMGIFYFGEVIEKDIGNILWGNNVRCGE